MSRPPHPNEPLVLPGELLGTAEEFVPGLGTYEDNGRVYAALAGHRLVDAQARAVSVRAVHEIPRVNEGDLLYVRVDELKSAMAICSILASADTLRAVPGAPEGTVHISKAREGYTETLSTEFGVGDILIAKVLQAQPTVKLTTAPAALGVVSARCQSCHAILVLDGHGGLHCARCGASERRKIAKEYGALHTGAPEQHAPAPL